MLTTDFTGTYDYEQNEAFNAANYILESLHDGEITPGTLPATLLKSVNIGKNTYPILLRILISTLMLGLMQACQQQLLAIN